MDQPDNLRFFSERVFGAWVEARVVRRGPKWVTLSACFWGSGVWAEKILVGTEVYYPRDHPMAGEAFLIRGKI